MLSLPACAGAVDSCAFFCGDDGGVADSEGEEGGKGWEVGFWGDGHCGLMCVGFLGFGGGGVCVVSRKYEFRYECFGLRRIGLNWSVSDMFWISLMFCALMLRCECLVGGNVDWMLEWLLLMLTLML